MESDSGSAVYESLDSVLAVAIAAFTKRNYNWSRRGQRQSVSAITYLDVDGRYHRQHGGNHNPPAVKRA